MINNDYLKKEEAQDEKRAKRKITSDHELETAPPNASKFMSGKWVCEAKQKHQQYRCTWDGCKKRIRTYCSCSPGVWICNSCWVDHIRDEDIW